ncbi:MAG: response regulator [Ferruginibacter sp.]
MAFERKKILLAEDDYDDRIFFLEHLNEREDVELMPIAENGVEVLKYLDALKSDDFPDLIILDQNMPMKNGIQTLEDLKSIENFASIPVVIYSTYADNHLIETCMNKGAETVVTKPLAKKEYGDMMDNFMQTIILLKQ